MTNETMPDEIWLNPKDVKYGHSDYKEVADIHGYQIKYIRADLAPIESSQSDAIKDFMRGMKEHKHFKHGDGLEKFCETEATVLSLAYDLYEALQPQKKGE